MNVFHFLCLVFLFDLRSTIPIEADPGIVISSNSTSNNITNIQISNITANTNENSHQRNIKKRRRRRRKNKHTKNLVESEMPETLINNTPLILEDNISGNKTNNKPKRRRKKKPANKNITLNESFRLSSAVSALNIPQNHTAKKIKTNRCALNNGGCSQICKRRGRKKCACLKGFRLRKDSKTCTDIDECKTNNGGCKEICENSLGSYICKCSPGLRLSDDFKSCEDINECLLRNGHGPCQDTCTNNYGSYSCDCHINGTRLSRDDHSCEDIDECQNQKSGCSHICTNAYGTYYCSCPDGYELMSDFKTCRDINECDDPKLSSLCKLECINIPGSYFCEKDYQNDLNLDKAKIPVCPQLDLPINGYITCLGSENAAIDTYSKSGRKLVKNDPGTKCKLNCPIGYKLVGSGRFVCKANGNWSRKKGFCEKVMTKPKLECPEDQELTLEEDEVSLPIKFSPPRSNISLKYLKSYPEWATKFGTKLKEGHHVISFSVTDPTTSLSATCSFSITLFRKR